MSESVEAVRLDFVPNRDVDSAELAEVYPNLPDHIRVLREEQVHYDGSTLTFASSSLYEGEEGGLGGVTIPRACGNECAGGCKLADEHAEMEAKLNANCATANIAKAFELSAESADHNGFESMVLTPTAQEVIQFNDVFLGSEIVNVVDQSEYTTAYMKAPQARAVILDVNRDGYHFDQLQFGVQGADAAFGTMHVGIEKLGEEFVGIFSAQRDDLGDQAEDHELFSKMIVSIVDHLRSMDIDDELRGEDFEIRVDIGAAASKEAFKFDVRLPEPGSSNARNIAKRLKIDEAEYRKRYDLTRNALFLDGMSDEEVSSLPAPETVRHRTVKAVEDAREKGDLLTTFDVLDAFYPGAWDQGLIYSLSEVETLGENAQPITDKDRICFGDSYCVDYRGLIEYTVKNQLRQYGIKNVGVSFENAINQADPNQIVASNRKEDLAGWTGGDSRKSNRTLNMVKVDLHPGKFYEEVGGSYDDELDATPRDNYSGVKDEFGFPKNMYNLREVDETGTPIPKKPRRFGNVVALYGQGVPKRTVVDDDPTFTADAL